MMMVYVRMSSSQKVSFMHNQLYAIEIINVYDEQIYM